MTALLLFALAATGLDSADRAEYIAGVIGALQSADPRELEDTRGYIDVVDRNECHSAYHRLRVQCLLEAARRNCRGKRGKEAREACLRYSDAIVANKLGEPSFVTDEDRYAIMRRHRDFRRRLRQELHSHYASLAVELVTSPSFECAHDDSECLARAIDAHCAEVADHRSLSWQHCTAAIAWFIGTTRTD